MHRRADKAARRARHSAARLAAMLWLAMIAAVYCGCRAAADRAAQLNNAEAPASASSSQPAQPVMPDVYELAGQRFKVQVMATNLIVPWAMAWLPDGRMLLTERPGRVVIFNKDVASRHVLAEIEGVDAASEHGLMGIAVSPGFQKDRTIVLSYTGKSQAGKLRNRVVSFRLALSSEKLIEQKVLVDW